MRPERDALEIRFPRVAGYRVELPEERLTARFTGDSTLELTPDLVGPTITRNTGIIGEALDLGSTTWTTPERQVARRGEAPKLHLFGQIKRITREWRGEQPQDLGRWAFAELTEIYQIDADFKARIEREFNAMMERAGRSFLLTPFCISSCHRVPVRSECRSTAPQSLARATSAPSPQKTRIVARSRMGMAPGASKTRV